MSQAREVLRGLVLAINRWPLGLRITRLPYYAAIRAVAAQFARNPSVLSAYARNSFARNQWVPGRSDIDLTVVLRSDLTPEVEMESVQTLQRRYANLQRWFPMLGEVEILNQAHVPAWTRFGITGYECRHWLQIYGEQAIESCYDGGEREQRHDMLCHAINVYHNEFVPALASARPETLVRYVCKIVRYLGEPAGSEVERELHSATASELQARVVQRLEQHALTRDGSRHNAAAEIDLDGVLGGAVRGRVVRGETPARLRRDAAAQDSLGAVLVSANDPARAYYVPKNGLDPNVVMRCISVAKSSSAAPMVMPVATLGYYLRFVDPLEHLALLCERILLWGDDPLPFEQPWSDTGLRRAVCTYSTQILALPYSGELREMSDQAFRDIVLGWVVRTAKYFDDGVMEFDYERLTGYLLEACPAEAWDVRHPDASQTVASRFLLLRALADRINRGMLG